MSTVAFVRTAAVGGLALWLSACGSGGEKTVEACEVWLDTMVCGETDNRDAFDCSIYAEQRCDASAYFGCLTAKTECDEETSTFDLDGWTDCAVLAGCE